MVNRLVSVGDDFTLPAAVKVVDANLPANLQPAALNATYAKPVANTFVVAGDSITEAGWAHGGRTFWAHAENFTNRQMQVIYNAGIGGNTTAQLIARFQADVLSKGSDWVHILIGRNDIMDTAEGGYNVVTTGITTLLDMCRDAGKRAVVGTIIPGNGRTVQQYSAEHRINAWIRNLPFTRPVIIADYASTIARPDSNEPIVGSLHDTTHPGFAGAALMGRKLADTIRPFLSPTSVLLNSELDAKNLLSKGRFSGGGAGTVPTSWFETGAAGGARTYSKVERTDGTNGNWQRVLVPNDASVILASNVNIGATLAIGDTINFRVEYKASAAQVMTSGQYLFASLACYNGAAFTTEVFDCQYGVGAENWIKFDRSGVFLTGDMTIPAGTTLVQARIQMAGGVTLDLDRASVQKI